MSKVISAELELHWPGLYKAFVYLLDLSASFLSLSTHSAPTRHLLHIYNIFPDLGNLTHCQVKGQLFETSGVTQVSPRSTYFGDKEYNANGR